MSLSEIHRMLNYVPELVIQELGEDMARARSAGLALTTDAMTAGTAQSVPVGQIQNQPENPDPSNSLV